MRAILRAFNLTATYRAGVLALCVLLVLTVTVGLSSCTSQQIQTDIQKVLILLPAVSGIANAAGNIVAAVDPGIALPVKIALGLITGGFTIVDGILTTYQTNLASIPNSTLAQLDGALAAIGSNMSAIEAQYGQLPQNIIAGLTASLASLQVILALIGVILPAPVAAMLFPRASASMAARGIRVGASMPIPTKRAFIQDFNSRITRAGFPKERLHTPWVHAGPVPVWP